MKVATATFTFLFMLNLCSLIHSVNASVLDPIAQSSTETLKHFIVFDEVGQLASSMTYIHVQIPVNITSIYIQADVMRNHFKNLMNHPLPNNVPPVFAKAIQVTVGFFSEKIRKKNGSVH